MLSSERWTSPRQHGNEQRACPPSESSLRVTTVVDPRTACYHPDLVRNIAEAVADFEHDAGKNPRRDTVTDTNRIELMGDGTLRSTLATVTTFKDRGINHAIVVGFVTGPTLNHAVMMGDTERSDWFATHQPWEQPPWQKDTTSMFERAGWSLDNLHALLDGNPPYVTTCCWLVPHFESRSDKEAVPGETIQINKTAAALVGMKKPPEYVVTLGDHSYRLHREIQRNRINHVSVTANPLFVKAIQESKIIADPHTVVVVSPDIGAVANADDFSRQFARANGLTEEVPLMVYKKDHDKHGINKTSIKGILRDVDMEKGTAIIVDDEGDSLGTNFNTIDALDSKKPSDIILIYTQAVHSKQALLKLKIALDTGKIKAVFITNSRPLSSEHQHPGIHIVPVDKALGTIAASLVIKGRRKTERSYQDFILPQAPPHKILHQIECRRERKTDLRAVFQKIVYSFSS